MITLTVKVVSQNAHGPVLLDQIEAETGIRAVIKAASTWRFCHEIKAIGSHYAGDNYSTVYRDTRELRAVAAEYIEMLRS